MAINELTEKECLALLERASVGRLGCALDNQPYVVPIYLAYEPGFIYVFSTYGKKIEWMRANPKVCVEVDEVSSQTRWVSVVANGRYEELPEPQYERERAHARQLLQKKHHWWVNALAERRRTEPDETIMPLFFRIHIDSVSGLQSDGE
jgi:nitroimidazol reductase NimA-like FMN-containing flavoprotein (pyridoxamine 5'-phosphate oxidase superfamily)